MRKGKDIIGKPIVTLRTGERIASVQDVVFDQQANLLLALLVDEGGWFRAARVVPFGAVRSFGDDAIIVESPEDVVAATNLDRVPDILNDKAALVGATLMTTDGKNLGKLADMYFEETTGRVVGYEVTGGLFSDLSSGRSYVPAPETITLGEHVALVPPETALAMEEAAPGGLRGAVNKVTDNVKSTAGNLADATKERQKEFVIGKTAARAVTAADGALVVEEGAVITPADAETADAHGALGALVAAAGGGALQETFAGVRERVQGGVENLSTATRERQKEFVTGKVAGSDVSAPDGTIVVTKGDQIMPEMVERAEEHGVLPALLAAAGGGVLSQGLGSVRERLGSALENLRDAGAARQKEFAVGKVASREVIADDGTLVAARNQVVTSLDADRAEAHGALLDLLAAVDLSGGRVGSVDDLRAGAAETFGDLRERATDTYGDLRDRATDTLGDLRERVIGDDTSGEIVGRRVQRDVYGPEGRLVAAQGQIVTPQVLDTARLHGRETDLAAATLRPNNLSNAAQTAGDRLEQGAQTVREGAASLLDRAKEWVNDTRERAEIEAEERQIRRALGRPVTRVILDPQDRVILNVGEIVTHKAVDLAREGGVLPILFDSVSTESTSITPEESAPPVAGIASLQPEDPNAVRLNEDGTNPLGPRTT